MAESSDWQKSHPKVCGINDRNGFLDLCYPSYPNLFILDVVFRILFHNACVIIPVVAPTLFNYFNVVNLV